MSLLSGGTEEQLTDLCEPEPLRPVRRGRTACVFQVGACTCLEELRDGVDVAAKRRHHQRRHLARIAAHDVEAGPAAHVRDRSGRQRTVPADAARDGGMWWQEFTDLVGSRSVVTHEQMQRIGYMAENLAASPEAVTALTSALTEISLIWQDEATGLWVKTRPDCIPDNGYDFGDLKTFAPKGGDLTIAAQRSVTEFGYAQQMALAMEGAERVLGQSGDNCMLVFVMTSEPYEVVPILLEPEALYWARVLNRKALDQIVHGILTGDWPMRVTHPVRYEYPPSMLHQFGEAQARGDLPSMERWT
jgi:hypothetical protein